jgi:hypothetical protein
MNGLIGVVEGLLGLALFLWARTLSLRYNVWTTGLRESHPNFNPPPTPEWRARNTKIMTFVFRITGVIFIFLSCIHLLTFVATKFQR